MADTRQIVSWSLERKCPFRTGDKWFLPEETSQQLNSFRTVASAEADQRNVDGICVTSWTMGMDNAGEFYDIPSSGFSIEQRLSSVGGLSAALLTCGACEANVDAELGTRVAGCFGYLDIWPDSEELDARLRQIIEQRGMEQQLRAAFPVTSPLWYGFWINSPVYRVQAEFLHELLSQVFDPDDQQGRDVRHFLNALMAAIRWELPLHVALAPLGHTDLGWYTIFPHCPRCKANAPVGRWKESYPTTPHECRVCGFLFNPNEHHSSKPDDIDWSADDLKKQLGEEAYDQFVRKFLLHRGCSPEQANEIIDNENHGPLLRRIGTVRKQRNTTLRRLREHERSPSDRGHAIAISITLAEGVDMDFSLVFAGEFLMGSPEGGEHSDELPQHPVRIERPFYIGRYPVTQQQWTAVMGRNTSKHRGDPQLPVDQVSWFDCQEFCQRLCQSHGRVFRLPSEAEWEYACRAGTTTKYAFGDTLSPSQANFTPYAELYGNIPWDENSLAPEMELAADDSDSKAERNKKPSPVGMYPPNAWGIYDMHGNVDEWCEDVWHPNYEGAPSDGSAWLAGEDKQPFRVMRGGWAAATEFVCTSTSRRQLRADAGESSSEAAVDDEEAGLLDALFELTYMPHGFRVVCEIP